MSFQELKIQKKKSDTLLKAKGYLNKSCFTNKDMEQMRTFLRCLSALIHTECIWHF
jgi:hypothetical protein